MPLISEALQVSFPIHLKLGVQAPSTKANNNFTISLFALEDQFLAFDEPESS
jgi:hypothetical protein